MKQDRFRPSMQRTGRAQTGAPLGNPSQQVVASHRVRGCCWLRLPYRLVHGSLTNPYNQHGAASKSNDTSGSLSSAKPPSPQLHGLNVSSSSIPRLLGLAYIHLAARLNQVCCVLACNRLSVLCVCARVCVCVCLCVCVCVCVCMCVCACVLVRARARAQKKLYL